MNSLRILETILSNSAPKRKQPALEGVAAYSPTILIVGAREWIKDVESFARLGYVKRGDKRIRLEAGPFVYSHCVEVTTIINSQYTSHRTISALEYPSDEVKKLCHGQWATFGDWQYRLPDGLQTPEFEAGPNTFTLLCNIEARRRGVLLRFVRGTIEKIVCDREQGVIHFKGLPKAFVTPNLVWGPANSTEDQATAEVSQTDDLESKLEAYVENFRIPPAGTERGVLMRRLYNKRFCRQQIKAEAGITSMIAWWLASWAIRALINRLADRLWNKIHNRDAVGGLG